MLRGYPRLDVAVGEQRRARRFAPRIKSPRFVTKTSESCDEAKHQRLLRFLSSAACKRDGIGKLTRSGV